MTDALFSLEDFGLRVEPTQAMRDGTQVVDQCAYCGAVVVWHRGLYRAKLGQCPACDTQQGWWGQKLPVAGIHEHGIAILAPQPAFFGLARQTVQMSGMGEGETVNVFRDRGQAVTWLTAA